MFFIAVFILAELTIAWSVPMVSSQDYYTQDEQNKKVLKQAVLGAGTGAIAAGASGGSAGKGALIGAGTNVIGGAILDTLTSSPQQPPPQQVQYVQTPQIQYAPAEQRGTYDSRPVRKGGCSRN